MIGLLLVSGVELMETKRSESRIKLRLPLDVHYLAWNDEMQIGLSSGGGAYGTANSSTFDFPEE